MFILTQYLINAETVLRLIGDQKYELIRKSCVAGVIFS